MCTHHGQRKKRKTFPDKSEKKNLIKMVENEVNVFECQCIYNYMFTIKVRFKQSCSARLLNR